jgi:GDP-4-dehydro-6-deoxy-D-mannose reductase
MTSGLAGRAYNVCSGRARRMRDLLERLCELASVDITIETDPARLRPNDVPVIEGDATRLRAEVGWAPAIDLDDTLRDTLDWWRAEVRAGG